MATPGRLTHVLLEGLLVGAIGLAGALAANTFSPRGLRLTRNYAPGSAVAAARTIAGETNNGAVPVTLLASQLAVEGLQLADGTLARELFENPQRQQGLVVFVDARDDEHFVTGHIPGALQLDHYHPERYLAEVLPACNVAQKVVVYCKGGNCEDSEQTAIFLRDAGIPREHLFVYAGGFDEWTANHLPVETGQRATPAAPSVNTPSTGGQQ